MNNYGAPGNHLRSVPGLVLNEIGMLPLFNELLLQVMALVAKRLFGDDEDRLSRLKGQPTIGNWGGSQLDKHHTFVVQYSVENDRNLDMHIDEQPDRFVRGATGQVRHHLQRGPLGVFRFPGQSASLLRHVRRRRPPEAHAHLPPCEAMCSLESRGFCVAGGSAWSTAANRGMGRSISSRASARP